jgi:hypothetical protein
MSPATVLAELPTADRASLLDELGQLRHERGAAALDGRKFADGPRIAAIESALAAQDDAEAVAREREIAVAHAAEAGRIATLRAAVAAANIGRLAAIANAQAAFDYCLGELGRAIDLTGKIRASGVALSGPSSLSLSHNEVERRISRWIAGALTGIGRIQQFGDLEWNGTPMPCTDWHAAERDASDPAVALLLGDPAEVAREPAERDASPLNEPCDTDTTDEGDE